MNVIQSLSLSDACVGIVINQQPLKVKINDKIIIGENEIVRTGAFIGKIKTGTQLLFLRETGGQRFFIINTIINSKNQM